MTFSFAQVRANAARKKQKRRSTPGTPVHNFMDVAAAVVEIAKIIDPEAFDDDRLPDIAPRRGIAMQKARDAVAAYDRILGNQRRIHFIVKQQNGTTRRFTVTKGKPPG